MKYLNVNYILTGLVLLLVGSQAIGQQAAKGQSAPSGSKAPGSQTVPAGQPMQNAQPAMSNGQLMPAGQPAPTGQQIPVDQQMSTDAGQMDLDYIPMYRKKRDFRVRELTTTIYMAAGEAIYLDPTLIVSKVTLKYNDKGNVLEEYRRNQIGEMKTIYRYDANNRDVLDSVFKSDTSFQYKVTTKFDEKGTKAEKTISRSDGSVMAKTAMTYDNNNNLIEEKQYDKNNKLMWTKKTTFDDRNYAVESSFIFANQVKDNPERKTTFKYDSLGNRIEKRFFMGGKQIDKSLYNYDEKGNEILKVTINQSGKVKIEKKIYTFDSSGNWILKSEAPNSITLQEITFQ